jgi:hypothetical protein
MAITYMDPPSGWLPRENPYFGEPSPESELGLITTGLYGLETLQRTGFCAHPSSEPHIRFYLATSKKYLSMPTLVTTGQPGEVEKAVATIMRPFYQEGNGQVLCPVCLLIEKKEQLEPIFLARSEFLPHWEKEHYGSFVAATTFSATQLHTRIYLGSLLYTLAVSYQPEGGEDYPDQEAYSEEALKNLNMTTRSYLLQRIWKAARSEGRASPIPKESKKTRQSTPECVDLADGEQLLDEEDDIMTF